MYSITRRILFCRFMSVLFLLGLTKSTSLADETKKVSGAVVVKKHKVFIDQGHNPKGTSFGVGAKGLEGLDEGDVTFSIGKKVKELLEKKGNYEVMLSRPDEKVVLGTNQTSGLAERVNKANNWGADVFVSIHCNSFDKELANGTECYIYKGEGDPLNDMRYSQSGLLAALTLSAVTSKLGTTDRGVKTEDFYVIKNTNMPAALVELAFITNRSDANKLINRQNDFAEAVCKGITEYFRLFTIKEKEKKKENKKDKSSKKEKKEKKSGKKEKKHHEGNKASKPKAAKSESLDKKVKTLQLEGTFDFDMHLPLNLIREQKGENR